MQKFVDISQKNNLYSCMHTSAKFFVNFYKLHFLLAYNAKIDAESSVDESDWHRTEFFLLRFPLLATTLPNLDIIF